MRLWERGTGQRLLERHGMQSLGQPWGPASLGTTCLATGDTVGQWCWEEAVKVAKGEASLTLEFRGLGEEVYPPE